MPVDVQTATDSPLPEPERIRRWAEATLAEVSALWERPLAANDPSAGAVSRLRSAAAGRSHEGRLGAAELCVRVVDEEESRRLNRDYRHKDAPTNVLSFPAGIDLPDALILGDVVVCAPVVQREADQQQKPYEHHFAHMVVHGVLHLLGYDHQTDAEASVMEKMEIGILDHFQIGDPYGEG
ncbi:MAG TPA: rRNA maturation RNase YbeY [Pseudomonadales bacterium]